MRRCKDCVRGLICHFFYEILDKEDATMYPDADKCARYSRLRWKLWAPKFILMAALLFGGCSPGQHHGHIYIHDPNHVEAVFDRPMSMSVERDGTKVEASSLKPGFFEDVIKFLLIRPR